MLKAATGEKIENNFSSPFRKNDKKKKGNKNWNGNCNAFCVIHKRNKTLLKQHVLGMNENLQTY